MSLSTPTLRRVLVAEAHPITRFGICSIVRIHPSFEICGEAGNPHVARRLCAERCPDLIVVGFAASIGDPVELIKDFRALSPASRTIVVGNHLDFMMIRRCFEAGARGFVANHDEASELFAALELIASDRTFISFSASEALTQNLITFKIQGLERLSDREMHIFRRFGSGQGPAVIARALGVAVKTVETHQQRIRGKLELKTAAQLTRVAKRWMAANEKNERNAVRSCPVDVALDT